MKRRPRRSVCLQADLDLITPAILPAFSFSARYDVSTSRCIAVHRPSVMNLPFRHAGEDELIAIRAGNVEAQLRTFMRPARRRRSREPAVDEIPLMAGRGKRIDEIGTYVIAAGSDTGTDRDDDVRRMRPYSRSMAFSAATAALAAVPRQPACTAATAPESRSAISIGTQSAARTAIATSAEFETSASASGGAAGAGASRRTTATVAPWTCVSVTTRSTPTARASCW